MHERNGTQQMIVRTSVLLLIVSTCGEPTYAATGVAVATAAYIVSQFPAPFVS